jgi:hypothetical protein
VLAHWSLLTLSKISSPELEVNVGSGDNFKTIWNSKMPVPTKPIHVEIPPTDLAAFIIGIQNWRHQSTYFTVDDNYNKYKTAGVPNCLGNYGMDGNTTFFWTTGKDQGDHCGLNYDFSKVPTGTSIPTTLTTGINNEVTLNIIWDVTQQSSLKLKKE